MKPVIALLLIALVLSLGACPSPQETILNDKVFVGSVNSDIYHYPSCEWAKKIHKENEIWFSSVADAHSKGYRACKVCRPPS